jgi:hypothetical protein
VNHTRCIRLVSAAFLALAFRSACAQTDSAQAPVANGPRYVHGQVRKPLGAGVGDSARPVPVPGEWVVLHRVGSDHAGPLDSVRTDARGGFTFHYTASGAPDALYFVSSRYRGIAYFSPPLRAARVSGDDADIIVYDTTTDASLLRLQGRHFVVSAPRGSHREVVEIFDVLNGGTRTVVPRDSTTPVWSMHLATEAESASVAPGDIALGAVTLRQGVVKVFAPIAPGARQLVLTYLLPASAFPWSQPIGDTVSVVEVLLEEPTATAEGARLALTQPASIDGRTFRRYVGQDVPASAVVRITVPDVTTSVRPVLQLVTALLLAAMIVALGAWIVRRRGNAATARIAAVQVPRVDSDVLVAEIAALDVRFERIASPTAEERAAYEQRRAALTSRLSRALAEEKQPA